MWAKIEASYGSLLQIANSVNKSFGITLAICIINDVLYYSTNFHQVFIIQPQHDWHTALRNALFFCNTCVLLMFAANIERQMNCVYEFLDFSVTSKMEKGSAWTTTNKINGKGSAYFSPEEYLLYVNYFSRNRVTVKAANIFPVTYSLIATVSL